MLPALTATHSQWPAPPATLLPPTLLSAKAGFAVAYFADKEGRFKAAAELGSCLRSSACRLWCMRQGGECTGGMQECNSSLNLTAKAPTHHSHQKVTPHTSSTFH